MNDFTSEAPQYWSINLSALPIKQGTKRPAVKSWQSYENTIPDEQIQQEWLLKYENHGIGLNLGTKLDDGFTLVAVDVDDDKLVEPVQALLGNCPSAKQGKKGITFFAKAHSDCKLKSKTIKGGTDIGNIDFLSSGRQTVLPPSIHPETNEPYVWVGSPICDVGLETLPILDAREFKVLIALVGSENTAVVMSGNSTHEAGVALVAQLIVAGAQDAEIEVIFDALLPKGYSGNSRKELSGWTKSARTKGFDEAKGNGKAKASTIALKIFEEQGVELFHDLLGECYAVLNDPKNGKVCHRVKSSVVRQFIQHKYYKVKGAPLAAAAIAEVLEVLEAKATFDAPTQEAHVRFASYNGKIFIDIGPQDGRIVEIGKNGWKLTEKTTVNFRRPEGYLPLIVPKRGGDPNDLQELLGLDDTNFILVVAFILNCFNPDGPYMLLLAQGEQGSGKSFICELIKRIVDPSEVAKMRLPKTEHDLAIQAKTHRLLVFDNAGSVNWEISDALCTMATGGAFVTRKYYTDDEARVMKHKRPVIMNGIGEFANRPDLLERSAQINLKAMPEQLRKTEAELNIKLDEILPSFMGFVFDCVAHALKTINEVDTPKSMRMADAAKWIVAAEPATEFQQGSFLMALEQSQREAMTDRIVNDPLVIAMLKVLEGNSNSRFEGTFGELHALINEESGSSFRGIPQTAAHLSNSLSRLNPSLKKIGLIVEIGEKTRRGRMVEVHVDDEKAEIDIEPRKLPSEKF